MARRITTPVKKAFDLGRAFYAHFKMAAIYVLQFFSATEYNVSG